MNQSNYLIRHNCDITVIKEFPTVFVCWLVHQDVTTFIQTVFYHQI